MIRPQHDTHIDNCVHLTHNVHDSWEIRIPIRTSSENIVSLAMVLQTALDDFLMVSGQAHRNVPVNIGVQGE